MLVSSGGARPSPADSPQVRRFLSVSRTCWPARTRHSAGSSPGVCGLAPYRYSPSIRPMPGTVAEPLLAVSVTLTLGPADARTGGSRSGSWLA